MKLFAVFIALTIYAFTLVQSLNLPEPNVKCTMNCDLQEFKPVCAADDAGNTKTFKNICIMKTENCLQTKTFQKIGDKECP